jgi:hypothetical protein
VIVQLKVDLTVSNRLKVYKGLNQNVQSGKGGWYGPAIGEVKEAYKDFVNCMKPGFEATSLGDITGLFSAIVDLFKTARDFRAEQIKIVCTQLDGLRLRSSSEVMAGKVSATAESKEDEEKTK